MRNFRKIMIVILMGMIATMGATTVSAKTVTKKVTIDMSKKKSVVKRPGGLRQAKKVSVKSSRKSVAAVKYSKRGHKVKISAKKAGKTTITVKARMKRGKVRVYRYLVTVKRSQKLTSLQKSKEAFRLQNKLRRESGVKELQWSDELYQFALYRLKTSGFDDHKYILRDTNDYFGKFFRWKRFLIGENLTEIHSLPEDAMKSWKKSKGHCDNLMAGNHKSGAIAEYKGMWSAIFVNEDKSFFDGWREYQLKKVTLKRYDSSNERYLSEFSIGYYETNNRWDTMSYAKTKNGTQDVYLEVGKTYSFYEKITPDGCEKAERVTLAVDDDSDMELIMKN